MNKALLFIQLNEINFDLVNKYIDGSKNQCIDLFLPYFFGLMLLVEKNLSLLLFFRYLSALKKNNIQ